MGAATVLCCGMLKAITQAPNLGGWHCHMGQFLDFVHIVPHCMQDDLLFMTAVHGGKSGPGPS